MGNFRPTPPCDLETGPLKARPPPPPSPHFHPPAPQSWFSWLVPLIFAANIAMFVYTMAYNDCPAHENKDDCLFHKYLGRFSFQPFKENALLGPSSNTLIKLGGLEKKLVVEGGEGWRLLSCMWLHVGVVHLAANMLSLLFIGIRLEQEFGFVRIGVLYLLAGFGGSLLSALHAKSTVSCAALFSLVIIIAINLAVGFLPGVDNSAHIGGFISGFLLGFILLVRPQFGYVSRRYIPPGYEIKRKPRHKCYQYLYGIIAIVLLIVGYAYGSYELFTGQKTF
ncbi:rhomboid-like protein 5 [Quercus suber]|uniref:RHOMBOID-like protein n=1 Tax=Quercus suber TaxID=58331 RepID=A0AAW0LHZ3_QUESU